MVRNKEETKSRILQAVGKLLAESGFNSLGINAIAKEARVDKVLIYRYFTDLPTLLQTFGREGNYLSGIVIPPELENAESLADALVNWVMYFQKELEERPITQEIIRWELVEGNELTNELRDIRRDIATKRLKFLSDKFGLPADQDTVAIMTILGSAVIYLQLRSKISPTFSGLDFSTDEGWGRIDATISTIIHAVIAKTNTPQATEPKSKKPKSREKKIDSISQD
jgi:AcrR family transcriptional regulator